MNLKNVKIIFLLGVSLISPNYGIMKSICSLLATIMSIFILDISFQFSPIAARARLIASKYFVVEFFFEERFFFHTDSCSVPFSGEEWRVGEFFVVFLCEVPSNKKNPTQWRMVGAVQLSQLILRVATTTCFFRTTVRPLNGSRRRRRRPLWFAPDRRDWGTAANLCHRRTPGDDSRLFRSAVLLHLRGKLAVYLFCILNESRSKMAAGSGGRLGYRGRGRGRHRPNLT